MKSFTKEGLEIAIDKVPIVDSHRLPQHPLFKLGKRLTRPIVVKLAYMDDKTAIYKVTKNLNNRTRLELKQSTPYVFITDHLPRTLQEQRKKLIPYFNKARADNPKTKSQIENRENKITEAIVDFHRKSFPACDI